MTRLAEAHASEKADIKTAEGDIAALKAQVKALTEEGGSRAARLKTLEDRVREAEQALDKVSKNVYAAPSVPPADTAQAESLKKELEKMRTSLKAFAFCLALLPMGVCELAAASKAATPSPSVTIEAPPAPSADMWEKHAQFFERFRVVWTTCKVRPIEPHEYIEAAKWFNENGDKYDKVVESCKKYEAHGATRSWPPGPRSSASAVQVRHFSRKCDQKGTCEWKQD